MRPKTLSVGPIMLTTLGIFLLVAAAPLGIAILAFAAIQQCSIRFRCSQIRAEVTAKVEDENRHERIMAYRALG